MVFYNNGSFICYINRQKCISTISKSTCKHNKIGILVEFSMGKPEQKSQDARREVLFTCYSSRDARCVCDVLRTDVQQCKKLDFMCS